MRDQTVTPVKTAVSKDAAREAIAKLLGVDVARLIPDASLTEDLKLDSIDSVTLIMDLERLFDVQLPDKEAAQITTVSEMIDFLCVQTALARSANASVTSPD